MTETGVRAFFYNYKYYLFPEEMDTLAQIKQLRRFTARRLLEERCMAPDFIYESIIDEELEIEEPNRLFEVYVTLRSGEEYDRALLNHINRSCQGCVRYSDDGDDITGHHREMSLNGVCYERESESDPWEFAVCVDYFWWRIGEKRNELAACIDAGDQKKLNRILNREFTKFCFPLEYYGSVVDGKYTLHLKHTLFEPNVMTMIGCGVVACGADENGTLTQAGWNIVSYREAGSFSYSGKTKIQDETRIVGFLPSPNPNAYNLSVYHARGNALSEKRKEEIVQDIYDYLVSLCGEQYILAFLYGGVEFTDQKRNILPTKEVVRVLKERAAEFEGISFPPYHGYGLGEGAEQFALPYRADIREGQTRCTEMSFFERSDFEGEPPLWSSLVSYAYLFVPRGPLDEGKPAETLIWYLSNLDSVPAPIRDEDETLVSNGTIGFAECEEDGFIIDMIVFGEKSFFRSLKRLAPVLRAFEVKLVLVNRDGLMVYECGYDFNPTEDTPLFFRKENLTNDK